MGVYIFFDLVSTLSGDLQLDTKGDVKLATTFDTQYQAANFWLRTDHGDYAAATEIGTNLGEFIGSRNSEETLEDVKDQVFDSLIKNLFYPEDIRVETVPIDQDEILIAVEIAGEYLDKDAELIDIVPRVVAYTFPYVEGSISPVD